MHALQYACTTCVLLHACMHTTYTRTTTCTHVHVHVHVQGQDMARTRWTVCTTTTCAVIHTGTGKCDACISKTRATQDKQRRPTGNPYANAGHKRFRSVVLDRDPVCVVCHLAASTVADHHPVERVDLIAQGMNPDDPTHGRGVCKRCHDHKGGINSGWSTR